MRIKKRNLTGVFKYAAYFALLIVTATATTASGLKPFGLGTFVALVFAGQNVLILAPMYLAANLLSDFSWQSAVVALTPAIIFTAAYFLHHRFNKRLGLGAANGYALLSQVPYVALYFKALSIYQIVLTVVIGQIFVYIAILALYAVVSRKLRYRLTVDESISLLIFTGVTALSLYSVSFENFNLLFLFFGFAVLATAYLATPQTAIYLSVAAGLGCAFSGGGLTMLSVCVLLAAAVVAFKNTNALCSTVAMLTTDAVLFYYFDAYGGYGYLNVVALAAGSIVFLLLPQKYKNPVAAQFSSISNGRAGRYVVNKNRQELSLRLYSLSSVFEDMQNHLLGGDALNPVKIGKAQVAKEVAACYCGACDNRDACFSSLGTDTSGIIADILQGTDRRGKASIIDMPPFITSRCKRLNGLISAINERADRALKINDEAFEADRGRQLLAVQMGGVAEILDNLADEYKKPVSTDVTREKLIVDELTYLNISCREVMVYGEGSGVRITALISAADAKNGAVIKVISRLMRIKLMQVDEFAAEDGFVSIHLAPAPRYDFIYGEANRAKCGEEVSGDAKCVKRISPARVVFVLSDGMGAGRGAEAVGGRAAEMVENFFEAGFSAEVVTALSNKLLTARQGDSFSALDMLSLNLETGAANFIKLGATYTLIKRGEQTEFIEGQALPAGIIEGAKPFSATKLLSANDVAVLLSDGVTDVVKQGELAEFVAAYKGVNPQALADDLINLAVERGATDDITAIVVRVFLRA